MAKQLKSFLGLTGYYRKFVPQFSKIAAPLHILLKRDAKYLREKNQEIAFHNLKQKLMSQPILQYPDFSREFILTTDASNDCAEAVLSQGQIGKDLPMSGNKCVLTFQDDLSKFIVAVPFPQQDAETIAKEFVLNMVLKFGAPAQILTDPGSNFVSDLF